MRALEKNIKGFNLLELLIVIVIMGFVSAVAYPNLSGWSKERKARGAAIKIKSLIEKNVIESSATKKRQFPRFLMNCSTGHFCNS